MIYISLPGAQHLIDNLKAGWVDEIEFHSSQKHTVKSQKGVHLSPLEPAFFPHLLSSMALSHFQGCQLPHSPDT